MIRSIVTAVALIATASPAMADATLHDCLRAATAIKPGSYTKVEYLGFADEQEAVYEIEVRTAAGREWEFECSAYTGAIVEIEQEVDSPSDELFKSRAKLTTAEAQAVATRIYPGTVEEIEFEIEANGDPSYEFDIVDADGVEFKVEVDAATGDIVEVQVESWEIGEEDRQ